MERQTANSERRKNAATADRRGAFTIIELLVVVSIIALLISILVPSLSRVKKQVRATASRATVGALESGVETFKADSTIGGHYPPSASDKPNEPNAIMTPYGNPASPTEIQQVSGANLLVFAMFGADRLGTPGFLDRLTPSTGGQTGWWDDMTNATGGAYELLNGEPVKPRFGPFCDDTMTAKLSSVARLEASGDVTNDSGNPHPLEATPGENFPFFVDEFNQPILYYRARAAATFIVTNPGTAVGVYDHRDNQFITGGTDVGGVGVLFSRHGHSINGTTYPGPTIDPATLTLATDGFAGYIVDRNVAVRPTPVNRETYLLISPGPDGIYGSRDDITNWD